MKIVKKFLNRSERHARAVAKATTTASAPFRCGSFQLLPEGEYLKITSQEGKFKMEDVVKTCSKYDLTPIGVNRTTSTKWKFVGVEFIGGGFGGNLWKSGNFQKGGEDFQVVWNLEVFEEKIPVDLFQELIRRQG